MIKDTDLLQERQRFICLGKFELPDSVEGKKMLS